LYFCKKCKLNFIFKYQIKKFIILRKIIKFIYLQNKMGNNFSNKKEVQPLEKILTLSTQENLFYKVLIISIIKKDIS